RIEGLTPVLFFSYSAIVSPAPLQYASFNRAGMSAPSIAGTTDSQTQGIRLTFPDRDLSILRERIFEDRRRHRA
ncbi:MAG TPA: hypothetical protein VN476_17565, partial [Pyrinomonadaceae bacterium]|nr:hypothetical protein [Pyrinomonadaceae bacterium]